MQIDYIVCPDYFFFQLFLLIKLFFLKEKFGYIEDKLESEHHVTVREARQVLLSKPRIRFAEKGHTEGNDVYGAFGQTFDGRYLSVFFVYKPETKTAIIISARNMSNKERKAYGHK